MEKSQNKRGVSMKGIEAQKCEVRCHYLLAAEVGI